MNDESRPAFRGRAEDLRFLTGRGRYVDDLREDGALFGNLLRSPLAHGRITAIDVSAAAAMPGVALVLTYGDLAAEGIGPLPCPTQPPTLEPIRVPSRPLLADGIVRHVGDPVAFVVAETPAAARDAAESINVAYEELPALPDVLAHLLPRNSGRKRPGTSPSGSRRVIAPPSLPPLRPRLRSWNWTSRTIASSHPQWSRALRSGAMIRRAKHSI